MVPLINEILELKERQDAIILAHSYVSPEILVTVADAVGDSYELSLKAKQATEKTIVFAAVKFMGETAKLLNPEKQVLIPSQKNGCSLADSITQSQVKQLRSEYPDHTFVCYINTTAEVKAECDVCVTSSNVTQIVSQIDNDKIYFLPDRLMGQNLVNELAEKGVKKEVKYWDGTCYVHEDYDPELVAYIRQKHPKAAIVSHPECSESVVALSDYVGSTSQMMNYVKEHEADQYFLLTECGLTSRLQTEVPNKQFIGSCSMCKYMKSNTLDGILQTLKEPESAININIDQRIQKKARSCIDAMFDYNQPIKR
ncbi:MAG: quinolinate synthase [Actinobacteria bacterium]|nr:quinolinate synthase [Actinomycetota bacterium]